MDYFNATFYDSYTALTKAQILDALTPAPTPAGGADAGLCGRTLRLKLDSGKALEYTFGNGTLELTEDGAAPVCCPYGARALEGVTLVAHMVPGTLRGYVLVLELPAALCTVFDVWFGGFAPDLREVRREFSAGCIVSEGTAPTRRHTLTNRIEGTGLHWRDDDGKEMLYFFPSVVWSSFVELSDPRGGITVTAASDYLRIDDSFYIYSRVEQEFGGAFTLEVLDLFTLRHIGVRLGFDRSDALDFHLYGGVGEITGRCTNLEDLSDYGSTIPFTEEQAQRYASQGRGGRPSYRPRFLHKDYTQAEVDEIVETNSKMFESRSIMSSRNTMEPTGRLTGCRFTLRYDDGSAWEYEFPDETHLRWRCAGAADWHEEATKVFEPAKDILLFSHVCTGTRPLRCLTQAVDFSNGLATCVDARLGNGRKPWEVGHCAIFGVLEMEGGPTPPVTARHGFTRELLGKCFAWTYSEMMQSIHVYSTPESYSWTIMLPGNTGGIMWSSPCLYVKLRSDAYLMSWTEDGCNGNQGTMIINPRIMHDAGYFFGISDMGEKPDVHLHEMGAFGRPLAGYDLDRFFEPARPTR